MTLGRLKESLPTSALGKGVPVKRNGPKPGRWEKKAITSIVLHGKGTVGSKKKQHKWEITPWCTLATKSRVERKRERQEEVEFPP